MKHFIFCNYSLLITIQLPSYSSTDVSYKKKIFASGNFLLLRICYWVCINMLLAYKQSSFKGHICMNRIEKIEEKRWIKQKMLLPLQRQGITDYHYTIKRKMMRGIKTIFWSVEQRKQTKREKHIVRLSTVCLYVHLCIHTFLFICQIYSKN